ncbi:tetratricopeptide repeat protein [[Eubacterium] cellulosolvens]
MKKGTPRSSPDDGQARRHEFAFASKEGLIIVSLILFGIYAFWYKIFEIYYFGKSLTWPIIMIAYSLIVTITLVVLVITGFFVLWKDWRYLIIHEGYGAGVFLIGALILLVVPLCWTWGFLEYFEDQGIFASNSIIFVILGGSLCVLGTLILARTGGFFIAWLIGVSIYLIMSFHEGFSIFIYNEFFGVYDDTIGAIGVVLVATSFILFLYHDLKFFYLSRVIKRGNKYRRQKQYKDAIRCFNRALRIYPLFTTAWNNMGNVYYNQGKTDEAIKCYKKALYFNPEYINAKRNLAVIARKTK